MLGLAAPVIGTSALSFAGVPFTSATRKHSIFSIGNFIAGKQSTFLAPAEEPQGELSARQGFSSGPALAGAAAGQRQGRGVAPRGVPAPCLAPALPARCFSPKRTGIFSLYLGELRGSGCNFYFHNHSGQTSPRFVMAVFLRFSALHPIPGPGKHLGGFTGHANGQRYILHGDFPRDTVSGVLQTWDTLDHMGLSKNHLKATAFLNSIF